MKVNFKLAPFLRVIVFGWILPLGLGLGSVQASSHPGVKFNRDILPILSDNCFHCHGPDEKHRKAKLRLDTREGLFTERDGESIVKAGDPSASLLMERITTGDADDLMPPPESKKTLTSEQITLLRSWIEQGADWEGHWAFITPTKPELPEVADRQWLRNAIDYFVLNQLERRGLNPNQEADRRTLIRRVTLDLTGLPPTIEEVEAFVNDPSANAYEQVVDRLLASERFGERMSLAWMDAARYGDSSVFHADGPRFMWPWRDWVIQAYNNNMPFDQFTMEQLAGDLMPNATVQQRVASGFNRNHGTTDEGGAIAEEYRVEYVVDRVKTTSEVWLGLTLECGQCHDHKYDPISQKEYYQFYAYFNNTKDAGMQTRNGNATPIVRIFSPMADSELKRTRTDLAKVEKVQKEAKPKPEEIADWVAKFRENPEPEPPVLGTWHQLGPFKGGNSDEAFKKNFGPEKDKKFSLKKKYAKQAWTEKKDYKDGAVVSLGNQENSAIYLYRTLVVEKPEAYKVSLGSDDSIKVWLNDQDILAKKAGRAAAPDQEKASLKLVQGTNHFLMKIVNAGGPTGYYFKLGGSGLPDEILNIIKVADAEQNQEQKGKLTTYYADNLWADRKERTEQIKKLKEAEKKIIDDSPTSMIMEDNDKPRKTYVLNRGHYASPIKEEEIFPGVPSALPALAKNAPANRLGLAQWLMDDDHPLTPRVAVNRYWQMFFGRGLVDTVSDFGTRGEWPSHPDLIDWLARDFVDSGWNIKRALKQMVMSATYRQGSTVTAKKLEHDPENRLLSRAPRLRLQGEFVRDNALALSGLLNPKVGGPSVKPYQPKGIWNEVSLNGGLRYKRDAGEKLYRRSMYIYWKRSAPMPSMMAFDAPTREKCVIQRQRTNTPLQALVTLNDVQFVEASRFLAHRLMKEGGETFADRLNYGFLLATGRPADDLRHRVLKKLYDWQLAMFEEDEEKADAFLKYGERENDPDLGKAELAAWTMIASTILNLDEVITKE